MVAKPREEVEPQSRAARLRQHLANAIEQGLEPHTKLPAERELAVEFEVTRLTVRRALDRLENDGLVYRVRGSGTFVAAARIKKTIELTSFSEDMRTRGLVPGSSTIVAETIQAGPHFGAKLRMSPAAELYHIRRIRTADGKPMALEDTYLNPLFLPGIINLLGEDSLYKMMENKYSVRMERAEQRIWATVLEADSAMLLSAPAFSPALFVARTSYDAKDRAIEYAESIYRGDRYQYELEIHRS